MALSIFDSRRLCSRRRGFTLVELLVVIAIIGTLVGLLLPAVQSAREAARRSSCSNNIRQVALSVLNFESARQKLPAITDRNEFTGVPGTITNNQATTPGYGWIVHCLPFMEETGLYTAISQSSGKFANSPFASTTQTVGAGSGGLQAADQNLVILRCPTFTGDGNAEIDVNGNSNGVSYAPAYSGLGAGKVALTNYKACAGTHLMSGTSLMNNGAMTYPTVSGTLFNVSRTAGIPLGSIADGSSKTVMLAESKERGYGGWIDGTATWVVAMNLSGTTPNYVNNVWTSDGSTPVVSAAGTTKGVGINFAASGTSQQLPTAAWTPYATYGMAWGASSEHAGGVVLHAFADGHISLISSDIDTQIYPALYSRGKNEPIQDY